jgi:sigma-B regulation protein RsbU (phosphoserine phosphatase)
MNSSALDKPVSHRLVGLYVRNYAANLIGNVIIALLNLYTPLQIFKDWTTFIFEKHGWVLVFVFIPAIMVVAGLLQYAIQRPLHRELRSAASGPDTATFRSGGRRLLNLPVLLGAANLFLWTLASVLFLPFLRLLREVPVSLLLYIFFRGIMIALIASFLAFFLVDDYCRKRLIPLFFPEGKLAGVRRTFNLSILRRIRVLFGLGTNAPMIILVGTLGFALWEVRQTPVSAAEITREILGFTVLIGLMFVAVSLSLNFLVGRSILTPIREMMVLVKRVRKGDYRQKVRVVSNDELGVLGDGMNEMTEGLLERQRLQHSLDLAKEVQQALLPRSAPRVRGLDIAARSIYCDETGGDFYDYLPGEEPGEGAFRLMVGDVSGHGIPAALLMATARAFLRQRSAMPGRIADVVTDANRQLARDVEDSGGFMTLFYLAIDPAARRLDWVRAGHDPAFFFDPASGFIEELKGEGIALGIDDGYVFRDYPRQGLRAGQILLLGTDGIWESRNDAGEMFGKEPIFQTLRRYGEADAQGILTACLHSLERFRNGAAAEDDVTLIVIKVKDI